MPQRFGTDFAGRILAGRYEVLELLGAGGMGVVYRAHDRELDEVVALKVIHSDLAERPEIVERFRREVKLARRVTHANIARTFELGSADGVMYCTMELIAGESLRERLVRTRKLPIVEAASVARALCDGLAAAHGAGIIHRDIKPDNVLLADDGRVILADFGIAALAVAEHGDGAGTPAYMAPEQARGESASPATDVYAVGVLLYEMVTGKRGFTGDLDSILEAKQEVPQLVPGDDVPGELGHVIGHATAREREDRIASAAELGRLLGAWTRPGSSPTIVAPKRARDPHELHTVIVLAPRADGDVANQHLAEGFHEELLRKLAQRPRIRMLPRVAAGSTDAETTIELVVRDGIEVTVRRGTSAHRLQLPLAVSHLAVTAEAIANLVAGAVTVEPIEPATQDAIELWLRARHTMQRGIAQYEPALALIERAHALAPDDPRIAATLALACVRVATFDVNDQHGRFARARELVREALMTAPELAETHVAAAHLELHTGEAAAAAIHFRRAIACSRYIAEGHEGLGRLLLEAGFLDVALARLDEALAIAPHLSTVRWDIARAWALEGRWDKADPMVAELRKTNDRVVARTRFACWRGSPVTSDDFEFARSDSRRAFNPAMLESLYGVVIDGGWYERRDALIAKGTDTSAASKRAHALFAQLVAEIAGFAGDAPTSMMLLDHAASSGLFDLHWLERCPLLAPARREPGYAGVHARVKARADAILDALYGDLELGALSDTVAV